MLCAIFEEGRGLAGCGCCIFVSPFCNEDSWILVLVFIFIFDGGSVRCSCPSAPVDADDVLACFALIIPSWFILSDDGSDSFDFGNHCSFLYFLALFHLYCVPFLLSPLLGGFGRFIWRVLLSIIIF